VITYRLKQISGERALIIRGAKSVGTITNIKGVWHGRLRVAGADAVTAKGADLVAVFNQIVDQRVASW
jgi:hypothetical protein